MQKLELRRLCRTPFGFTSALEMVVLYCTTRNSVRMLYGYRPWCRMHPRFLRTQMELSSLTPMCHHPIHLCAHHVSWSLYMSR